MKHVSHHCFNEMFDKAIIFVILGLFLLTDLSSFCISWLGLASIPKSHRLSRLNNRNLFSQSPTGWKTDIKMPAGLISSETSLLALQMMTFFIWSFFLNICVLSCLSVYPIFSYKDISQIGIGSTLKPYFNLITSLKLSSPNTAIFWSTGGLIFQHNEFWGDIIQPITLPLLV